MITYAAYVARDRAQMESEFENYRKEWERSEAMLALKDVMALITKQIYIDDVVNFGLGSLHTMTEEGRKDSGLQTAALLTIMDCICRCLRERKGVSYAGC